VSGVEDPPKTVRHMMTGILRRINKVQHQMGAEFGIHARWKTVEVDWAPGVIGLA
jgi:hypothetical protein